MTSTCDAIPQENQPVTSTPTTSALLARFQKEHRERRARLSGVVVDANGLNFLREKYEQTKAELTLANARIRELETADRARRVLLAAASMELKAGFSVLRPILRLVAHYFGVTINDIRSDRRHASLVLPRHVFCYLAKQLTVCSFAQIGRQLNDRDHSTICHAADKIENRIKTDFEFRDQMAVLEADIREALNIPVEK
jgi:chromosomal replication initiator protein